ncbi:MAG: hypothetical protein A3F78_20040 [Burkholderiales bacterium RIFCSPLOWO2_12_FULL_61_40]|nr:MAG: hypothetical protein A3F78_20040 [Burkholderiales bacterium RIFCSPLOWO2_12_FULL_61_40]
MKLKMAKNSLFAILLRSPWWVSLLIVAAIALVSGALLSAPYAALGVIGGFPFLVVGAMAAWRQRHAPKPDRVAQVLGEVGAMSWRTFADALAQAFARQGYTVTRRNTKSVDMHLRKDARVTLVSCQRWKAASHGVDALRALVTAKEAQGADQCIYVSLGQVTENARRFASAQGVQLVCEAELVQLMADKSSTP